MNKNAYKIGVVIIIISWIACLNPFLIIFVAPIFIVGIILVWVSKKKIKTKLLVTLIPLLLWFPCMILFIRLISKHMTPETFLISEHFRGQITLIYNEPCGQTLQKENGRLIYKIPNSGVMILTNKFETGIIKQEYYFIDASGKKIQKLDLLEQTDFNEDYTLEKNKNEPPRNKIGIFLLGTGNGSSLKNMNYKFHLMAVNSYDSFRVMKNTEPINNLSDSLLFECRTQKQ